ncbi:MAG TPA: hypothetical protein VFE62_12020 [Gemmataceae bacterium]|nr:hypothetical protein [Gemmataceae bacterium]
MHEDGSDRIRLFVRLEVQQVIRDSPPNAHRLIRFTDVGGDYMLEDWLDRLRNFGVGNCDEVVLHEQFPPASVEGDRCFLAPHNEQHGQDANF